MHRILRASIATLVVLALTGSLHAARDASDAGIVVVATDDGTIAVLDKADPTRPAATFAPFDVARPVYVATGDVDGDGTAEIVAGPGPGGGPHVKVFSATGKLLLQLTPFSGFTGGVRVATGDVNGDGVADIVTGAGPGAGPHVKVFDAGSPGTPILSFLAFDAGFSGGVFVAAGDVDGDGFDDIVVSADAGGGPHVRVFDGLTASPVASLLAYAPDFTGGVRVAAGDVTGDGMADIITGAGPGGGPHVKVFSGSTFELAGSFFAFDPGFTGGVHVGATSDDGGTVLVTPGASSGIATLRIFRRDAEVQWLMPFPSYAGGLTVAASPGPMGAGPARPRLTGGLKIESTWE